MVQTDRPNHLGSVAEFHQYFRDSQVCKEYIKKDSARFDPRKLKLQKRSSTTALAYIIW